MTAEEIYEDIAYGALPDRGVRLIEDYGRLQIEKDRQRIKDKYPPCKDELVDAISHSFCRAVDADPIQLD